MNFDEIERAGIDAYKAAFPALVANATQWQNDKFSADGLPLWAAFHFLPNEPVVASLGTTGQDQVTGLFQFDFNVPQDTGTKVLRDAFNTARNYFVAGRHLIYNNANVTVTACGRSPYLHLNKWFRMSVTVSWESRITR